MLTQNEITSLSLSPTKKDFVQIWNELLEVAGKLSERWDPTSTNESDPGIVILKALAGIADKLNYNIDKNTLEAFMPTAAQEDSMRKLCEMLGYNVKYYRSAKTDVTIKYHNTDPSEDEAAALQSGLLLPKFSVITNSDQDVSYFTINETPLYITSTTPTIEVTCMEGQLVQCESINDNNVITANQISENNRFYLPETQIAENGIFVYNIFNNSTITGNDTLEDGLKWNKVDNLNAQIHGSPVYKFGFDSYEGRPYLEFPEDYAELFGDGLFIYYARTSGGAGNISARTLTKLEFPSTGNWGDVAAESISVENTFSATTGANIETIKQAYNNFKKTVGTFETLVTCRDYMNKIYSMQNHLDRPLVSNILVTDIRNDLNRAVTICSCDRAGIFYKETALPEKPVEDTDTAQSGVKRFASEANKPKIADDVHTLQYNISTSGSGMASVTRYTNWYIGSDHDEAKRTYLYHDNIVGSDLISSDDENWYYFAADADDLPDGVDALGTVSAYDASGNPSDVWLINQYYTPEDQTTPVLLTFRTPFQIEWIEQTTDSAAADKTTPAMSHFDLVLYPFKSYTQIKNNVKDIRSVYDASFSYSGKTFAEIKSHLEADNIKTIAHNLIKPRAGDATKVGDIVSINNYLRLNATIATTSKITVEEGSIIIDKIKIALANAFNMRELDFGEEIPFDSIVEIMETADSRIRLVSLNEPALYTTFSVFTGYDSLGNPETKEYAVASDWLTLEQAKDAKRFDMDKAKTVTTNGVSKLVSLSTFNTKEARELYNKLAVRNVLAGRVPLFDYNSTFKTSFSEGAYQITKEATSIPASLPVPDEDNRFTICTYADKVYTGQFIGPNSDDVKYTETYVPEEFKNNVITSIGDNEITDITTNCKIFASEGQITDVELATGEFVKFRAPNFTTIKTYPAYVNYHLALNREVLENAINAEALTLFNVLNSDKDAWTLEKRKNNWQRTLDYFDAIDKAEGKTGDDCFKKTIKQSQDISAYAAAATTGEDLCSGTNNTSGQHQDDGTGKCVYCGAKILSAIQKGPIIIDINDKDIPEEDKDLTALLNKSGCIRISDRHEIDYDDNEKKFIVKPILTWKPNAQGTTPAGVGPELDIKVRLSSLFITSTTVLTDINEAVQKRLEEMVGQVQEDGSTPMLPTEGDWTITFEYVGVPFEPKSLDKWKSFILSASGATINADSRVIDFAPYSENDVIFWRVYGEGYSTGKYILQSTEKLLEFDRNYFGLLPESRLRGIYLIKNAGSDAQAAIILNDEEYRLRANEYLYIEYTPSSTTEDGTTKEADPVTEILGEGTIIKPSGFEVGLKDSSVYASEGTSFHKTVSFETETGASKQVSMHRFGANEQVEVRDFAKVELTKKSFKDGQAGAAIYYYKNFNGCAALEDKNYTGVRSYTLKDGEYIFYTDQNKAEFAYFTTGTEVKLEGSLTMDQFDVIELSTIFDSGISEIPWGRLKFATEFDKLIFQEFQYITLGPEDTIKKLTLMGDSKGNKQYLSDEWQYCDEVEYSLAGSEEVSKLSTINTYDDRVDLSKGCGWEASSTLELDVAYNSEQILRKTKQIQTSITLASTSTSGDSASKPTVTITPEDEEHPLAFKTNLSCQSSSTHINIDDIYSNPNKLSGFEFKVFAKEEPAIVETLPGRVAPYDQTVTDITNWQGDPVNIKSNSALWKEIDLANIRVQDLSAEKVVDYDRALRLPVSILPNTYGVFTLYVDYTTANTDAQVWIEVLPGTSTKDVTILNIPETSVVWQPAGGTVKNGAAKLILQPGINCVRVNKTGRFFVKASTNAQGSLFFDDLKLVNSTPISYTIKNSTGDSKESPASTYGLNVKQLGYLNPDDVSTLNDTLAVDEEIRKILIEGRVEDTYAKLDKIDKAKDTEYLTLQDELMEVQPKLATVLDVVETAKTELEAILNTIKPKNIVNDSIKTTFHNLFDKYVSLSEELKIERDLLTALTENKNLDILESDLLNLLENIASKEETQQKLLEELEVLKNATIAELASISRDTVEDSFTNAIKTIDRSGQLMLTAGSLGSFTNMTTALEKASREQIEQAYNAGMLPLINSIDKVVSSEERTKLLTVLSTLKENSSATARAELLTKVKQVIEAVDKTELDGLADTMLNAAINASYKDLDAILVRMKAYLTDGNFEALIAELEVAALESNDDQLKSVVVALSNLVQTSSSASSSLITDINAILEKTKNLYNYTAETPDATVTALVKTLYTSLTTDYKNKLTALLKMIYTPASGSTGESGLLVTLSAANAAYNATVQKLQSSTDEQVAAILSDIEALAGERTARLAELATSGTNTFRTKLQSLISGSSPVAYESIAAILPYGDIAIYKVWQEALKNALTDTVDTVVKSLTDDIKTLDSTTQVSTSSLSVLLPKSYTKFTAFAEKVVDAALKNTQETAYATLVSSLPVVQSETMTSALTALSNDTTNNNNRIVRERINEYMSAGSAAARQKAAKTLKEALTSNTAVLDQIVSAIVKLLCPSILNLEKTLPAAFGKEADSFYAGWITALSSKANDILTSTSADTRLSKLEETFSVITALCATDSPEVTLNKALEENTLRAWLPTAPDYTDVSIETVLPDELSSVLAKIKVVANVQAIITAAKETNLKAMSSTDIRNWLNKTDFMPAATSVVQEYFDALAEDIYTLNNLTEVAEESKEAYNHLMVEQQLLKDLRKLDVNHDFYYTAPTDLSLAIEFHESDSKLNTLMNPATNYDVNNINNSFVISKLDIDYIDKGVQIARSSRLN